MFCEQADGNNYLCIPSSSSSSSFVLLCFTLRVLFCFVHSQSFVSAAHGEEAAIGGAGKNKKERAEGIALALRSCNQR